MNENTQKHSNLVIKCSSLSLPTYLVSLPHPLGLLTSLPTRYPLGLLTSLPNHLVSLPHYLPVPTWSPHLIIYPLGLPSSLIYTPFTSLFTHLVSLPYPYVSHLVSSPHYLPTWSPHLITYPLGLPPPPPPTHMHPTSTYPLGLPLPSHTLGLLTSLPTHLVFPLGLPPKSHSPCTHPSGEPVLVGYGDLKNAPSLSECPATSINDVCYLVKTLYPSSQKQVPYNQLYGWQLYVDNRVLPIQSNTRPIGT